MAKAKKYVYFFGAGKAEGNTKLRNLLGGKGCDLAEMTSLGIPVPAGFTITTEVCTAFYANKKKYPAGLDEQVAKGMTLLPAEPVVRGGSPERITLIPYGCTKFRISMFPITQRVRPRHIP